MMIAILTPIFNLFEHRSGFRKALVLSVPFAANIGGMGTIIGTPPNAVAAVILADRGHPVSFLTWMMLAIPLVLLLLLVMWRVLILLFKPRQERFELIFPRADRIDLGFIDGLRHLYHYSFAFGMTEPLHHIPAAVVALIPVLLFPMFGIIDREDLKKVEWHVLILLAGGLTLGVGMKHTGLADLLVAHLPFGGMSPILLICLIVPLTILISNFMSHTAAANLIIPIVATICDSSSAISGTIAVAFAASLAMSLPISTPPNAIAFATRFSHHKRNGRRSEP